MKKHWPLLVVIIMVLAACATPQVATPGPTPEAIRIYFPPSLQPWADKLATCADNDPRLSIFLLPAENPSATPSSGDILLELGQPSGVMPDGHFFQVGWEHVAVIVNSANPISQLSEEQVHQIFSGDTSEWENEQGQTIQVWVLPDGESTRRIFDQSLDLTESISPLAKLAPDPMAMLEAVAKDKNAIGYLPLSFISKDRSTDVGEVKFVQLVSSLEQKLKQPVLAISPNEPAGQARNLLVCLQNSSTN